MGMKKEEVDDEMGIRGGLVSGEEKERIKRGIRRTHRCKE